MGFEPTTSARMHAKEIRGGSLTRKQVKNKASDVIMKAQDSVRYGEAFLVMFGEAGRLLKSDVHILAKVLALFEKLQFEVYDQVRKYVYAWVVLDNVLID